MTRSLRRAARAAPAVWLLLAASAHASPEALLVDCADDERLSRVYTQKDYREALGLLATDADEYGGCREVIAAAARAAAGAAGRRTVHGAASGDGPPPTRGSTEPGGVAGGVRAHTADEALAMSAAAERRAVAAAAADPATADVAGSRLGVGTGRHRLPVALQAVLALGVLTTLGAAGRLAAGRRAGRSGP